MDTEYYKQKLQEELHLVEIELNDIAMLNEETGEWEAKADDMETMSPMQDENEFADTLEELDEHKEELPALSGQWKDIKLAMEKIERGTYGKCEVCDKPIEESRLEINPSARTCTAHM